MAGKLDRYVINHAMLPIIQVNNISKQYRVTRSSRVAPTLREALVAKLKSPFSSGNGNPNDSGFFWAVKEISFDVNPGEVVGIVGRNGAGKSTLLKIISRITKPTSGEVRIYGRVGSLLEIGTGFHPDLTGRENIFLNGAIIGMKRQEMRRKFDDIVAFAEIGRFLDTPVKYYSSGMYVRLAFAVAAHFEPEVLILDEVLAVGDAVFQKKCLAKMKQVSDQGRTIFFVSHDLSSVRQFCTRALLVESGQLMDDGAVTTVIERYLQLITERSEMPG
jgi:lipopolysaccharide transport system ATP-binding protein